MTIYRKEKRNKNKEHIFLRENPFGKKTTGRGEENSLCQIRMITRGVSTTSIYRLKKT